MVTESYIFRYMYLKYLSRGQIWNLKNKTYSRLNVANSQGLVYMLNIPDDVYSILLHYQTFYNCQ